MESYLQQTLVVFMGIYLSYGERGKMPLLWRLPLPLEGYKGRIYLLILFSRILTNPSFLLVKEPILRQMR
jgi:hypothetical protein